ncbi:hypothetical protein GCM10011404_28210 [Sphingomonas prati]|nr:hypothetical protein [Sphingomonas prati]GGE93588.1 hypothetical protein GCM10011404_28210 [Sphingomonas prati]
MVGSYQCHRVDHPVIICHPICIEKSNGGYAGREQSRSCFQFGDTGSDEPPSICRALVGYNGLTGHIEFGPNFVSQSFEVVRSSPNYARFGPVRFRQMQSRSTAQAGRSSSD